MLRHLNPVLDSDPRRPVGDIVPPPRIENQSGLKRHDQVASPAPGQIGPLRQHITMTREEERASIRQVLEVSEGHVL